jgi:DNA-binding Xre family transcriptional regulator
MIVNKIKQFVDGLGITPYQFHKRVGVGKSTAYALYNERDRIPDTQTLDRICAEFNCNVQDIIEYRRSDHE